MNGPLWYSGPGIIVVPFGVIISSGAASGSTPTMSAGAASSMMPSSSRFGSRDDTGVGVAPTFHDAIIAAMNSTQFGSASTTMSPGPTPSAANSSAVSLASDSSSARVTVP